MGLEGPGRKTNPTSPGHRNSFHGQHGPKTACLATHHRLVQSVPTPRCQTWWGAYQTWTCGFPVSHAIFQAGHILGLCHKCNFLIPSITGYLEWFQWNNTSLPRRSARKTEFSPDLVEGELTLNLTTIWATHVAVVLAISVPSNPPESRRVERLPDVVSRILNLKLRLQSMQRVNWWGQGKSPRIKNYSKS